LKALIEDGGVQLKGLMGWERGTAEEKLEID